MLGISIADPDGVEGPAGTSAAGLGLLDITTIMAGSKILRQTQGRDAQGNQVQGYEIHMGRTQGPDCQRPLLTLDGKADGAISANGKIMGCYLHGLFASDAWRTGFLGGSHIPSWEASIDAALDDLAQHLSQHVKTDQLRRIAGL